MLLRCSSTLTVAAIAVSVACRLKPMLLVVGWLQCVAVGDGRLPTVSSWTHVGSIVNQ